MRVVTPEHDRHAMFVNFKLGEFASQGQDKAFLASQSNTLDELGDVACQPVNTVMSEKSRKLLCFCIRRQVLKEVCELLLLGALNSTNFIHLSHWPACISYLFRTSLQDFLLHTMLSLNFEIFGNPLVEIRDDLSHLIEGVPKIRDAEFLEDIR